MTFQVVNFFLFVSIYQTKSTWDESGVVESVNDWKNAEEPISDRESVEGGGEFPDWDIWRHADRVTGYMYEDEHDNWQAV